MERDSLSDGELNAYASSNRWRHEESRRYRQAAAALPRDEQVRPSTTELADFLNSTRIEPERSSDHHGRSPGTPNFKPIMVKAEEASREINGEVGLMEEEASDGREIICGPLLNYRRLEGSTWFGSVLIVTKGGGTEQTYTPILVLRKAAGNDRSGKLDLLPAINGIGNEETNGASASDGAAAGEQHVNGARLYSDPRNTFWAFDLELELGEAEACWEYTVLDMRWKSKTKPHTNRFFVPAADESMRIMFHSCNGFSVGTDEDAFSGPALWNDVLRHHENVPFHVMIGGGDQIYNDGIRVHGPLRAWTEIKNPMKRREFKFTESLRKECDNYYLKNYIRWYSTESFATANGQIPQLNIWDDHDIIDGFGSYSHNFMKCSVFLGIASEALKYYMLFQHHLPPQISKYPTDAPQMAADKPGVDPLQAVNSYVAPQKNLPCYIVGSKPGPYIAEHSHNIYARLGARIAFLGVDARTERTRHQVNYPETYELMFGRVRDELEAASKSSRPIKHLILLLGIPIAYPRLTWLENIFRSPLMGPIKFLNRRFGIAGGFINHFDGQVDLLDDLDDHYTARTHKRERHALVERLQGLAGNYSVRITILGGDVHLAALGRFYSNPKLGVAAEHDHRYMANVISSAITNKPPPQAIANLLARRNKIHHLDAETDETLLRIFNKDPGDSSRTAGHNKVTMPARNYAMITENSPHNPPVRSLLPSPPKGEGDHHDTNGNLAVPGHGGDEPMRPVSARSKASGVSSFSGNDGHKCLHAGEVDAGTRHKAADMTRHGRGNDGSLDICINVEINQHDRQGRTEGYGLTVPLLEYAGPAPPPAKSHFEQLKHPSTWAEADDGAETGRPASSDH